MEVILCIFCGLNLDDSDEHIIPECINGRLHSKKIVCHKCNVEFFGRKVDPIIKETFNPFLICLGFENASAAQGENIDGDKYVVKKGIKITPLRPIKTEFLIGTKKAISIRGEMKNTLKMFLKDLERMAAKGMTVSEYSIAEIDDTSPSISIHCEIKVTTELILLLNKIALEFAAYKNMDYSFIGEVCKKVRSFDTSLNNVKFCNYQNEIRDFTGNEISHIILLKSDPTTKHLYAYIELFNLICCVVLINDKYEGDAISHLYQQDALTGKKFGKEVNLKMNIAEILSYVPSDDNFEYLANSMAERHRTQNFYKVLEKKLKSLIKYINENEASGKMKPEDRELFYMEYSAQLVAHLSVYHFPYIIDEYKDEDDDQFNYIHSNFRESIVDDFCKKHQQVLGKKLKSKEGIFIIDSFIKIPIIVKQNKKLITLYFKIIEEINGGIRYIKVKDMLNIIVDAMRQNKGNY